jgi:anti-sigma regulatory factor (Ser/Thr protein kinase)
MALAARYLPAGREAEVGGDWYDAIALDESRVGVVIGDVVGHGITAAAVMGQLRNALRAYALEGHSPAASLERLCTLVDSAQPGSAMIGTVLFLVYDLTSCTARFASAGHLPPLVVNPDGSSRYIEGGRSFPLGTVSPARFEEISEAIEPGSTIVLYTDGLVERRGEPLDDGFSRLARLAAEAPPDLDALCDHLMASVGEPDSSSDDVALIALRPSLIPLEGFSLRLPAEPAAVPRARHTLRRWLAATDATDEETYDLLVACSDACANAVEHAYGPQHGEFVLETSLVQDEVVIAVRDEGSWRAPRGTHRGRGLALIEALTDSLDIDRRTDGTSVVMRRRLGAAREREADKSLTE